MNHPIDPNAPAHEYLTVRETARRLGVHENTVRNWAGRGLLQPVHVRGSRYRRFRASDVDALARNRELTSARDRRVRSAHQLVDADFLDGWARSGEAPALLPQVVRRLISATPGVRGLTLRAGGGVGVRGWDGLVADSDDNRWIPEGPSAWEIGTGADPGRKASEDIRKRTSNPLGVDPAVTTYVSVTPKRWPGARDWERDRREERAWRDVRVIDADDLAAWLEAHPATLLWLSERVGLRPLEVRTIERWWEEFRKRTQPDLPAPLLTAGRVDAAQRLRSVLEGPPAAVGVRAGSRDEALAFVAAAAEQALLPAGRPLIVVRSPEAWERLVLWEEPAVLVADADDVNAGQALARGHHVVVPMAPGDALAGQVLVDLPALDRAQARDALMAKGLAPDAADRLAGLARRSLAAFMRDPQIAIGPQRGPAWAAGEHARLLGMMALVGAWTLGETDVAAVASAAGRSWPEVEHELVRWASSDDPPFIRSGGHWQVASADGSWALLAHAVQPSDVVRFCASAVAVLGDAVADVPLAERLLPRPGTPVASDTLRAGVAQGLALLGAFDDALPDGSSTAGHAAGAVRELLRRANADPSGSLWASLSPVLSLLAEAGPQRFLDAIEQGLEGERPVLQTMFADSEGFSALLSASPHTGLLWSLELLCWSPEHLSRAAAALARLAELDPGGRLGNRPDRSLRTIFLPWIPRTSASLEQRLRVIDRLGRDHPDVAWELLLAIMPRSHQTSSQTPSPRFRAWMPSEEEVPVSEWLAAIDGISERAIAVAAQDPNRWVRLVDHLHDLPVHQRDRMVAALEALLVEELPHAGRVALWETLTKFVGKHRAVPDARWSLDDEALQPLDAVARRLQPDDPVERHAWLFGWHPDLPGADRDDYGAQQRILAQARRDAVAQTLELAGWAGVERLARAAPLPDEVGRHAGSLTAGRFTAQVVQRLGDAGELGRFAAGWVRGRVTTEGNNALARLRAEMPGWPADAQTAFLLEVGRDEAVVELLAGVEQPVRDGFWSTVQPAALLGTDPELAVSELIAHDRGWAALEFLSFLGRPDASRSGPPPDLIRAALDAVLEGAADEPMDTASAGYNVGRLLDQLEQEGADPQTMVGYEWAFFALLEYSRQPRALYRALAEDPDFFVELVCHVYRASSDGGAENTGEREATIADNAYSVLDGWSHVPGSDDLGAIDAAHLRTWVRRARLRLADRDRAAIGDEQIGQVLAHSLPGADGLWPAEAIRDLLEDLGSRDVEIGLTIGRQNARGVTTRALYAGGAQERALSRSYRESSQAVMDEWPRTGRVLAELADDYERESRREDAEADRRANSV